MTNIAPKARAYLQERVQGYELEKMENRFDDLCSALYLADKFMKSANESHDDVEKFIYDTTEVQERFHEAISNLGKKEEMQKVEASQKAYEEALDGKSSGRKFVRQWKKIQKSKVRNIVSF